MKERKIKGFRTQHSTYVFEDNNSVWNEKLGKQTLQGIYIVQDERYLTDLMYIGCMNDKTIRSMLISGKIQPGDLSSNEGAERAGTHRILMAVEHGQVVTSPYVEPLY